MITTKEYELLKKHRAKGYCWIARDRDECVYVYKSKPIKLGLIWGDNERGCYEWSLNDDSLPCIKWEDEKPTRIDDLIRDYESHRVIVGESVNKTELVKEIEGVFDSIDIFNYRIGESCENYNNWGIDSKRVRDIFSVIDKHIPDNDKEIIPQFVVDWIEEIKDTKCAHQLEILFDTASMPTEVYDWLKQDSKNWDILARAWLYGYEVEQEKLYTVRLANGSCLYKFELAGIDWTKAYSHCEKDMHCQLTQSEIESVDPRLMQFAVEVE